MFDCKKPRVSESQAADAYKNDDRRAPRVLLVSSSFPLRAGDTSGVFVRRLADALSIMTDLVVMIPCGKTPLVTDTKYPVQCFRYGPLSWQALTHSPGGIPVMLKRRPFFWFVVPFLLTGMFFSVYKRARSAEVLHANWSFIGLVCGVVGRLRRLSVITTLRGSDVNRLERSILTKISTSLVLSLSTYTVTVSSMMRKDLIKHFPWAESKLIHIPNGVDERLLTVSPRQPTPGQIIRIVSIGSLIPRKAVHELLLALAEISEECPFGVHIVGDGPEYGSLVALSEQLGLGERVHFAGSLPPESIAKLFEDMDVFVLTSHAEGRPNVLVEAMAAGRAVIATALPGVSELVEHGLNGLLFDSGDIVYLAAHLKRLFFDPDLRLRLGMSARQTIIEQGLTWKASAERYHSLYLRSIGADLACVD